MIGQSDFQFYKFVAENTFSLGILSYLFRVAVFPCLGHREVKGAKKKKKKARKLVIYLGSKTKNKSQNKDSGNRTS